jgi:hypothetical protein
LILEPQEICADRFEQRQLFLKYKEDSKMRNRAFEYDSYIMTVVTIQSAASFDSAE